MIKSKNECFDLVYKAVFFLYLCGLCGHNANTLIDTVISRGSLVLLSASELYSFFHEKRIPKICVKGFFIKYCIFVVYVLIACIWAKDKSDAFNRPYIFSFIQILIVAFFIEHHVHSKQDAVCYFKLMVLALAYTMGILLIRTPLADIGETRIGYEMGHNPNTIGIYCASGAVMTMYFGKIKNKYYILTILFSCIALLTGSRKGVLMLTIGCGIFWIIQVRGRALVKRCFVTIAVGVFFLLFVLYNEQLYSIIGYRIEAMLSSFLGHETDYSMDERAFFSTYATDLFKQKPIFGWGTNGFVTEMRRIAYKNVAYCHNNYLELLATLGIVGAVLYCRIEVYILVQGVSISYRTNCIETKLIVSLLIPILLGEIYYVSFYSCFTQIVILLMYRLLAQVAHEENFKS